MNYKTLCAATALSCLMLVGAAPPLSPQAQAQVSIQGLPDIADLVDRLLPSVVEISVQSKNVNASYSSGSNPNPFKDFFDEFFKRRGEGQGENQSPAPLAPGDDTVNSMGSGFIIDPKGLIVTNNHVIADAVNIQVHLQNGTILKAELVGHDPKTDIAVLRVNSEKDLPAVTFGDSDKTRIGQWVIAIGNPFGLGGSVSLGIISAKARDINSGPYDDFIQTDAAINKGNSGGPLFDLAGEVVGVNTAIFSPTGGSVGIGFSVPSNEAKAVAKQLIEFGETRRGWLGVKLQTLTPDVIEVAGKDKPQGALIADVTAGGPSEKAGLKPGDVITTFDGRAIDSSRSLRRVVAATPVGKDVELQVLRDGKSVTLRVVLGRLEEGEKLVAAQEKEKTQTPSKPLDVLGMTLNDLTPELREKFKIDEKATGPVITELVKDGLAETKGLALGDIIQDIGSKPITTVQDIADAIAQAKKDGKTTILALVAPLGKSKDARYVALKL